MSRLLAVLLTLTGLGFIASPAQAGVRSTTTVTMFASQRSVLVGDTVSFHGRAKHALPGTVLRLQRQDAGSWQTVASTLTGSVRRYQLSTVPPLGPQTYRVHAVRSAQQKAASSRTLVITARQAASIAYTDVTSSREGDGLVLHLGGTISNGPAVPTVDLQYQDGDSWVTEKTVLPSAAAFVIDAPVVHGRTYRLRLRQSDTTAAATTTSYVDDRGTYQQALNTSVSVHVPEGTDTALVAVPMHQGDEVTFVATNGTSAVGHVTSPSGEDLGSISPFVRFTATETGDYIVDFSSALYPDVTTLTISTPKVVPVALDGGAVSFSGDLVGQVVELHLAVPSGHLFTFQDGGVQPWWIGTGLHGSGAAIDPWLSFLGVPESIYRSDTNGTLVYRYAPTGTQSVEADSARVDAVLQSTVAVGDPADQVSITEPGQVALVHTTYTEPGDYVRFIGSDPVGGGVMDAQTRQGLPEPGYGVGDRIAVVRGNDLQSTGTVGVQFVAPRQLTTTVDGAPTPVDMTTGDDRLSQVSFTGTAGQVVHLDQADYVNAPYLFDSDDHLVPNVGGWIWRLPADGTYTLVVRGYAAQVGAVHLVTVPQYDATTDGQPLTVPLQHDHCAVVRIDAPAGAILHVDLSAADNAQLSNLSRGFYTLPGEDWLSLTGFSDLVMPASGHVLLTMAQAPSAPDGDLQVTFTTVG